MCEFASGQTTTTTALTVTSGGNVVSSISVGSMITLTASVKAASSAVQHGQVNFCDATAAYCTDIHLLGTAQLNNSGTAQLHFRPGVGSYSYKAIFAGTPHTAVPYAASLSIASTLTVTGQVPAASTITQSGLSGDYSLTASVLGFTKLPSLGPPTGTISFIDTTTNNSLLGMATLAPANEPGWVNVSNPSVGSLAGNIVAGDFNRDGNLDLAVGINTVINSGPVSASILLGDGQGHFAPAPGNSTIAGGVPLAVADFNQDGIPDLLLSDQFSGSITIALGKGDGTFSTAPGSPLISNYGVSPVAVADFNGDGIPDIATAGGYYMIVWLGNGDGSFTPMPTTVSTAIPSFFALVVGDFNGDGIPDLAGGQDKIFVYLGNGDGTFTQAPTFVVTTVTSGVVANLAAGDFNGDGKLDLAVPDPFSGVIVIFFGNGDGTFQPATANPTVGQWANRVAVGDFNGDGIPDLYVGAETNLTNIFVLLGNGDGTFSVVPNGPPQQACCLSTAVVDLNGDGVADLASVDFYNGAVDVFLTGAKQSTATISGISISGSTPQLAVASYPGDPNYPPSVSGSTSLLVQAPPPVFTPSGGLIAFGQGIAVASSTPGVVIYYQASGALQTNGYVQYFNPIQIYNPGSVTIQAYASAPNYGQSVTSTASYTVVPLPVLSSISPAFAVAGSQGFMISISGSGFNSGSTVDWGTTVLNTQFVSATQLTAQVNGAQVTVAGVKPVTVQNPAPGAGTSNVLQFEVDSGVGAPPSFMTTSATVSAGSTATYPVTLGSSATGISVSCLNLPSGASCAYSASAGALTIATSNSTPVGTYEITAVFTETLQGASASALGMFLFLPLGLAATRRRKQRICALVVGLSALLASSCGGGGSGGGTQPQTHQVTNSGVVTLTVQ